MTNIYGTFAPETFDQTTLDTLTANAVVGHDKYIVSFTYNFSDALADIQTKQKEDHSLDPEFVPVAIPLGNEQGSSSYMVRFIKSAKQIKQELEEIKKQVRTDYETHLADERERALNAMAERLVGEADAKEAKAVEQAKQQRLEQARIEAAAILGVAL